MKLILINHSDIAMPRKFIQHWMDKLWRTLRKKGVLSLSQRQNRIDFNAIPEVTVLFLNSREAKQINFKFRQKNYATDILSFSGYEGSLGELVICPTVIRQQSIEHNLTFREELGYMLTHGILHLLGFDHEKSKREATLMFQIQDEVFENLCQKFWK